MGLSMPKPKKVASLGTKLRARCRFLEIDDSKMLKKDRKEAIRLKMGSHLSWTDYLTKLDKVGGWEHKPSGVYGKILRSTHQQIKQKYKLDMSISNLHKAELRRARKNAQRKEIKEALEHRSKLRDRQIKDKAA
jgi:hypothetical protein